MAASSFHGEYSTRRVIPLELLIRFPAYKHLVYPIIITTLGNGVNYFLLSNMFKRDIRAIERRLDGIERKMNEIKRNMDDFKREMNNMKREVDIMKQQMDALSGTGIPIQACEETDPMKKVPLFKRVGERQMPQLRGDPCIA